MVHDAVHRLAELYDACWEVVREGASGDALTEDTRMRFVRTWGENSSGVADETMIAWATNFLRHNG